MAFVSDDAALDLLHPVAVDLGWRPDACHKGGLRAAMQALSVSASPTLLLVDLSDCSDPDGEINALAEVCEPGTMVVAIGTVNDVGLYRSLLARGVRDYLAKPVSGSQLRDVLAGMMEERLSRREGDAEEGAGHATVAVVGTRGGVGASTIAASLAWLLSSEHGRKTALLDLDLHFGTCALAFDLEPGRGLTDAMDDPGRIDTLFIERAMSRVSDRLFVLSTEASIGTPIVTDGSAFLKLVEELGQAYNATIIDMPRNVMVNFPHLMAGIETVVLVTEPTLAAARDTIRMLAWLSANAPTARVVLVANKVPTANAEIPSRDFESTIDRKIDFSVRFDAASAIDAARNGRPFVAGGKGRGAAAPLHDLARMIASEKAGTSGRGAALSGLKAFDPRRWLKRGEDPGNGTQAA